MIPRPLNDIAEADIEQLKAAGIQEGKFVEFKKDLPGAKDEDKREFLADVSSFANTDGGEIIYGVEEDQGVITNIIGVTCADFDAEKLRLENLVRDGIAPRIAIGLGIVACQAGKLLVVRIEKSWIGPHRVVFRGHDKFYARTSAGKFPLDVSQLRTAFLQSATLSEEINGFRLDRLIDVSNDRAQVSLIQTATLMLHVVPFGAFSGDNHFDVTVFVRNPSLHAAWNAQGWNAE